MNRDRYGGFAQIKANAAGFFRVGRAQGRWWLITPDGHGLIATGFNHASAKAIEASYNRKHWKARLPESKDFEDMAVADAKAWNMTVMGYGGVRTPGRMPYIISIKIPGPSCWMTEAQFPDMFAKSFEDDCERAARAALNGAAEDPWVIGYRFNDVPEWPLLGRCSKRRPRNWIETLKGLGPEAAGKQAYSALMRRRHGGVESFNAVYGSRLASFEALLADRSFFMEPPKKPAQARADDEAFLEAMIERYYEVAHGAARHADPNHMALGEILEGNRGIPPQVLRAAAKRSPLLMIQFYGPFRDQKEALEKWHAETGLPILLADSCFSTIAEQLPETCGTRVASHAERAEEFERYARQALPQPYVLGWIWCGYLDMWREIDPRRQHQGLKDAWGNPHEPLCSRIRETYARLYDIATRAL